MKGFCTQIRNFFEMHSVARIILYIAAMIQPAVYLVFGNFSDAAVYCLWIGFYSCLFLGIAFPHNSAEQIFSIVLIIINLVPIGLLFFGSLMLFPIGPILAFIYLWIPRIPGVSKEISIGIVIIVIVVCIAFIGKKKAEHSSGSEK